MADPGPITKWRRLYSAFVDRHNLDGGPRRIVTLLTKAMAPVRYQGDQTGFVERQDALNEVLVFIGLRINDEGRIAHGAKATTLSEAAQHAGWLRGALRLRGRAPTPRLCATARKRSWNATPSTDPWRQSRAWPTACGR